MTYILDYDIDYSSIDFECAQIAIMWKNVGFRKFIDIEKIPEDYVIVVIDVSGMI